MHQHRAFLLNVLLKNKLTAINQYFLHARRLRHWGITKFGAYEYKFKYLFLGIETHGQPIALNT